MTHPDIRKPHDLTQGPVAAHLVRLTLPMIWGILSIISFHLINTYFVGMLGPDHLAAISFTFPVTMTVFSFAIGLGIAMSSVLSRQIGQGNMDTVRRIATQGLVIAFAINMGIALAGYALIDPLFTRMGAPPHILPLIHDYMGVWFLGAACVALPLVGNAAIRATGDSRLPALIMAGAALVNLVLDPLLIFGLFGLPRLELQGAAISTIIANLASVSAGLYVLGAHKRLIGWGYVRFHDGLDTFKRLMVIALPAGLATIIQPVANAVIVTFLASHGPDAVAAFGIVNRVEAFAFVIIMAMATGMGPILGQNWGAGQSGRVRDTLRAAFSFNFVWSFLVAIILIAGGGSIAGLFSDDADVIHYAALFFLIVPATYAFGNLVNGWSSAFNAIGQPRRAFLMIVVRTLGLYIPLCWAGGALYDVAGVFAGMALANLLAGIVFHLWNWKSLFGGKADQSVTPSPR